MKQGKTIIGIIAGLAAGAMLGFLFAPRKGKETRQKIADKGKETLDKLKEKLNETTKDFSGNSDSGI